MPALKPRRPGVVVNFCTVTVVFGLEHARGVVVTRHISTSQTCAQGLIPPGGVARNDLTDGFSTLPTRPSWLFVDQ